MANQHRLPVRCCCDDSSEEEDETFRALVDTICGFYVEVVNRLPIREYPDLLYCLGFAAHCYGLLEPASNILVQAVAHHCPGRRRGYKYRKENLTDEFLSEVRGREHWRDQATRSVDGLVAFMTGVYRYLTRDQALRYLALADADVYFAMDLVDRDFDFAGRRVRADLQAVEELTVPAELYGEYDWIPGGEHIYCLER